MNHSTDSQAIRRRMESVRCELEDDVQAIVEGARDMSQWRSYVRSYPWPAIAAAIVVGYAIVPRTAAVARTAAPGTLRGATGGLLAMAGNLALREAASFVGQRIGIWLTTTASPPLPEHR